MAENKTKETEASVESYLSAIKDEARRKDCEALAKLMSMATK
jgi:ferritin-like metal-binding protein YciE